MAGKGEQQGVVVAVFSKDKQQGWEDAVNAVDAMTGAGYKVVRHFYADGDSDSRVFVFERSVAAPSAANTDEELPEEVLLLRSA